MSEPIERRLFLAGLAASGALTACSRAGEALLPAERPSLPIPQGSSPGSIVPPPMVATPIESPSVMLARTPAAVGIPLSWTQVPGSASHLDAAADGSLWVLSDGPAGPDKGIWHYANGAWSNISGAASALAAAPNGTLYVVNSAGSVYAYAGGAWQGLGGGASSVAALADSSVIVISNAAGSDKAIWRYAGGSWTQMPGGGVAVIGSTDGNTYRVAGQANAIIPGGFYIVNSIGAIYYMNTDTTLVRLPGNATDIATAVGGIVALGYPANASGNAIYFYDFASQSWASQAGIATDVSFDAGALYAVGTSGGIYRAPCAIPVPLTIDVTGAALPAGTPVYAYIIGGYSTDGGKTIAAAYRLDASGTPHLLQPSDVNDPVIGHAAHTFPNTGGAVSPADVATLNTTYHSAWADYAIPISTTSPTTIDLSKISPAYIPGLGTGTAAFSGRIYLSVGVPKLPFTPTATNAYSAPGLSPGTPGALCLFDWIEFSYDANGNFNSNPTQVNGIGLVLGLNGAPGGSQQGLYTVSRSALFSAINALGSPFDGLLVANAAPSAFPAGLAHLRALGPPTAVGSAGYSGPLLSYFDATIAQWYATWQTQTLVCHDVSTGYYAGRSAGPNTPLTFYQGQTAAGTPAFTLTGTGSGGMLSSADIWNCISPGSTAEQNVVKVIVAAFNRGVASSALDDGNCPAASTFYPSGVPSNGYARVVHANSANGLAYGFGYDDVCGANPSFTLSPAASVTIALQPLS